MTPRNRLIYALGALEGLVFGYDTGVVAGALLFLRRDMGLTPALQGLVVSMLLFGSIVAAPLAGLLSDRLGARRLIATAGVLFFVGSLGAALTSAPDRFQRSQFVRVCVPEGQFVSSGRLSATACNSVTVSCPRSTA
ncbi:MAG TPA: MFS transporter [Acetobacteraceae bacterium]